MLKIDWLKVLHTCTCTHLHSTTILWHSRTSSVTVWVRDSSRDGLVKKNHKTETKFCAFFGRWGCREKPPNCHKSRTATCSCLCISVQLFGDFFFKFLWSIFSFDFNKNYFSICTDKLHNIKLWNKYRKNYKKVIRSKK